MPVPVATRLDIPECTTVFRVDCGTGVAFVALHALIEGRAFGGIRIRDFASEDQALRECVGLAQAMSRKTVMANLPAGGAKTALIVHGDRSTAVARLGDFIESLDGAYGAGPDLGFTNSDLATLSQRTAHISCGDLGDATAHTVLLAMLAASPDTSRVAIQGLGSVGGALARQLLEAGLQVVGSDPRVKLNGVVECAHPLLAAADVVAPCAAGGVITEAVANAMACQLVCGAANNVLADAAAAATLRRRGIIHVPDFIANVGALLRGASVALGRPELEAEHLIRLPQLVRGLLADARRLGTSPQTYAEQLADERLRQLTA